MNMHLIQLNHNETNKSINCETIPQQNGHLYNDHGSTRPYIKRGMRHGRLEKAKIKTAKRPPEGRSRVYVSRKSASDRCISFVCTIVDVALRVCT